MLLDTGVAGAQTATWSIYPSPDQGSRDVLNNVSCTSSTNCVAFGEYYSTTTSPLQTLVESWNGTSWSIAPSPSLQGNYDALNGVSCSSTDCVAVGYDETPNDVQTSLIETTGMAPPVVTTQPTDQFVGAGGTVTFSAAASGNPSPTVQRQNSTDGGSTWSEISGATSTTYTITSVSSSDIGNEFRAVFTNGGGSATTNAARLDPPTTSVLIPSNGATLSGTAATLDASASNATSVEFRLFGGKYGFSAPVVCTATLTYFGWVCSWNTTTVPNGSYTLVSEASNAAGSTYSSGVGITVNNPLPTTSVLIPSNGAALSGTSAILDASASAGAGVANVQFALSGGSYNKYVIGTARLTPYGYIYLWNTTTVPGGTYTVQSLVTDEAGNSVYSRGIAIFVDNTPPTTAVLIPSTGASLSGTSAILDASASAYGVGITNVQFVLTGGSYNQSVIGTAELTLYGYIALWNTTTVPDGTYTLQSLATDAASNTAYSPGITVTVNN
jgi:hypothetical protein